MSSENVQIIWTPDGGRNGEAPSRIHDPCYVRMNGGRLYGVQGVLAGHIGG